jgi:CyaY protein
MSTAPSPFLRLADECLQSLQEALDRFDPDEIEADLSGGVLRLTFPDGRNCIANRQAAASQIWLAEGATAWHFAYDEPTRQWLDTKGRGEFKAILAGILTTKLGRKVSL